MGGFIGPNDSMMGRDLKVCLILISVDWSL